MAHQITFALDDSLETYVQYLILKHIQDES